MAATVSAQPCGTFGQGCVNSASCDDGNACNGTEVCTGPIGFRFCICDSTPPCDDGNPCTNDICTVTPRGIDCNHGLSGCSDGLYCNGFETCGHGTVCQPGTPPCAAPLLCDEAADRCVECLSNADCNDNFNCTNDTCADGVCVNAWCDELFCNGREICRTNVGCLPGTPPCNNVALCDEANDTCGDCELDADCTDDDDCTVEVCDANRRSCRTEPCVLLIESPGDQTVYTVGDLVDVVGVGPRGLDVALVFDESGSISAADFEKLKDFGSYIVNGLPDFRGDETGTKAGITMFSSGSRRILDLNKSRTSVANTIAFGIQQFGGSTCIGCGIDDGADNIYTNGRFGATKIMIVVTDGLNNLPPSGTDAHLAGALEAARFHGHVIFAIGVGVASQSEIQQMATTLPNRQTAWSIPDFVSLPGLAIPIINAIGPINVYFVHIALPDGTPTGAVIDPSGHWIIPNWSMLPGENVFTASIETLYGPKSESITLIGKYPCNAVCGDVDGDEEIGLRDVAVFQRCFGHPQWFNEECAGTDLNGDLDIQINDWTSLLSAWELPTKNQPPECPVP